MKLLDNLIDSVWFVVICFLMARCAISCGIDKMALAHTIADIITAITMMSFGTLAFFEGIHESVGFFRNKK